jgi:hypothetical protein
MFKSFSGRSAKKSIIFHFLRLAPRRRIRDGRRCYVGTEKRRCPSTTGNCLKVSLGSHPLCDKGRLEVSSDWRERLFFIPGKSQRALHPSLDAPRRSFTNERAFASTRFAVSCVAGISVDHPACWMIRQSTGRESSLNMDAEHQFESHFHSSPAAETSTSASSRGGLRVSSLLAFSQIDRELTRISRCAASRAGRHAAA